MARLNNRVRFHVVVVVTHVIVVGGLKAGAIVCFIFASGRRASNHFIVLNHRFDIMEDVQTTFIRTDSHRAAFRRNQIILRA